MQPITQNNSMKTHHLKHTQDRKKGYVWRLLIQPNNTSNNSMKTHRLKHRHDRRKENIRGGYSQPNTSNNSMKLTR